MADFAVTEWLDDDGSLRVGTPFSAAQMNRIEAGVKDAAQDSKQRGAIGSRPAASAARKNWIWVEDPSGAISYCDGTAWYDIGGGGASQPRTVDWTAITNVDTSSPNVEDFDTRGADMIYARISNGDRLLLPAQSTSSDEGIWIWNGRGVALTRADDFAIDDGTLVWLTSGVWFGGSAVRYDPALAAGIRSEQIVNGLGLTSVLSESRSASMNIPVPFSSFYLFSMRMHGPGTGVTGAYINKATLVTIPAKTINPKWVDLLAGDLTASGGAITLETTDGGRQFTTKAGGASTEFEVNVRWTTPATAGTYRFYLSCIMLPWYSRDLVGLITP